MDITKLGSTTTSLCVLLPDAEQWSADPKLGDCAHHDHADEEHHRTIVALRSGEAANVHSWELVTAVDGPGTRMTLFLAGCPLRCQYCHNPDTMRVRGGTLTPFDEVMERITRYRKIFQVTGGGVTISGGEPLMQPSFVQNVFTRCQELGIHTALDTSGFLGARATDELLQATNLVLLDVKSGLPETYKAVTARTLEPTIAFGDRLAALNKPVWVRFVLVPELTSAAENVEAVAQIVSRWPNVQRLEILPFHQMGQDKWAELGMEYRLADLKPPSPELIARVKAQFVEHGLPVFVG